MPVFIGDVLESCGGPILDLSTKQVKGLGVFDSISDRNDLSALMQSNGYLSVVGNTYPQISVHTGGAWDDDDNWDAVIKDVGHAINAEFQVVGGAPALTGASGFLIGAGSANFLRKGDVFHVSNLHKYSVTEGFDYNDGSYLVVDDPWNQAGSPVSTGPSKSTYSNIALILDSLHEDYVDPGYIVRLSETRPLIKNLEEASSLNLGDTPLNAALLATNNPAEIPVSITDDNGKIHDAKITSGQLIGMITAGVVDDYVSNGYGTVISYGGSAETPGSGGDFNGDGVIGASDLLYLLGLYGQEPEVSTNFTPSTVDIPMSFGHNSATLNSSTGFWDGGGDNKFYFYRDWGSGFSIGTNTLDQPVVSVGAPTVTLIDLYNATISSGVNSNASPPGDPIIFSGTSTIDFEINAFGTAGNSQQSRLKHIEKAWSENAYSGSDNILSGYRNKLEFTAAQYSALSNSTLQTLLVIKKHSSVPTSQSNFSTSVINSRIVVVDAVTIGSLNPPAGGGALFFNFNNISESYVEENEVDINDLYEQQYPGFGLWSTENDISCVAISVQVGIRILNFTGVSTDMQGSSGNSYAVLQNNQLKLIPHNS